MLSKEEVLGADDGRLNELCATKVMGWVLHQRNLRGLAHYRQTEGAFVEMQCNYHPTTDIAQAVELLDYLTERGKSTGWSISRHTRIKTCTISWYPIGADREIDNWNHLQHADLVLTKAIVLCALLAVVEMESA